jgi:hypothetical protein
VLDFPPVPALPEPPDPHAEASKQPAKVKANASLFFMILLLQVAETRSAPHLVSLDKRGAA